MPGHTGKIVSHKINNHGQFSIIFYACNEFQPIFTVFLFSNSPCNSAFYGSCFNMPADLLEKEKDIFVAQARESGKPDNIIEKMIEGRMKKFLKENTLLGQAFVKNPDQSIEQLLKDGGASIVSYNRLEVGEGIEKKEDDFVAEVMAQAGQG